MPQPMKLQEMIGLFRRLATSIDAGIDVRKVWSREVERARGGNRRAIGHISKRVAGGSTLGAAMQETGDLFPPLVHDLVRVGEESGHLEKIFAGLAQHYSRMLELRREYLRGIRWPAIQLLMALAVVGLFILVTGMIQESQGQEGTDILGLGLTGFNGFVTLLVAVGIVGLIGAFFVRGWSHGKLGAPILLQFLSRLPYLGECLRSIALARMSWTLSLASNTSMDVRKALDLSIAATGNGLYTRHLPAVRHAISKGRPIYEALQATNAFPVEFIDTIEAGETAGKLNDSLDFLSREYQARASLMSETLTTIAAVGTWCITAAITIFFIFRVFSVYLNAINGATRM